MYPITIKRNSGFTLIELIVTISIAAILASIGVPSLQKTVQNNRMTVLHNDLLSALSFARSTSITKGSWATFCNSNLAGTDCALPTEGWSNGWIVFTDRNNNGAVDGDEEVLTQHKDIPEAIRIISSRHRISYGSQGFAIGYTGKFTFCDARGDNGKKGMVVSNTGRVRIATTDDTLATCSSDD